jgi:hypothetical protein
MKPRVRLYNLEDNEDRPLDERGKILDHTRGCMVKSFTVNFGEKEITARVPGISEDVQVPLARRGG